MAQSFPDRSVGIQSHNETGVIWRALDTLVIDFAPGGPHVVDMSAPHWCLSSFCVGHMTRSRSPAVSTIERYTRNGRGASSRGEFC